MMLEQDTLESVFVLDDFLSDAQAIREKALALEYPDHTDQQYFPGRNSSSPLPLPGLEAYLSRRLSATLSPTPGTAHGKCRLAYAGDTGRGGVHIDQSHWSGVLYLSEPEDGSSGTDFFRHRPSGMLRAPLYPEELPTFGVSSFPDLWSEVIVPQTNDPTKWELVRRVDMRFNRLVLFRPWLWHNAGPGFGTGPADGRLVYLIFLSEPA
jgi:hypothetical protein